MVWVFCCSLTGAAFFGGFGLVGLLVGNYRVDASIYRLESSIFFCCFLVCCNVYIKNSFFMVCLVDLRVRHSGFCVWFVLCVFSLDFLMQFCFVSS